MESGGAAGADAATMSQAAEHLHLTPTRIKQLLDTGALTPVGMKPAGSRYWPRNAPRVTWTSLRAFEDSRSARRSASKRTPPRQRKPVPADSSRGSSSRTALLELKIGLDEIREELAHQRQSAKNQQADLDAAADRVRESIDKTAEAQNLLVRVALSRAGSADSAADGLERLSERYASVLGELLVDDDASTL